LALLAVLLDLGQAGARRAGRDLWFERALSAPAVPLRATITACSRGLAHAWQAVMRGGALRQENVRLRARVGELEGKLVRSREQEAAARRVGRLVAGADASAQQGKLHRSGRIAQVVGVSTGGWLSYLVVNSGADRGVGVRDVALAAEGLVGQVYAVTPHSARVLPITDPSSAVAALVQRTRERGMVRGAGEGGCRMEYLPQEALARPGDQVLTSGIGQVFPKGLRIGTVVSVTSDPATVQKVAAVKPAVDLQRVEEVLLVRPPAAGG
jgi:rod shape-determining protein MreC